jgi:Flp pilus assembly protein TadG
MRRALCARLRSILKPLFGDRRGNVAILTAVAMPVMVGFVGLAAEYGHTLMTKAEDQRIADLAAYSGALAYSSSSQTSAMTSAVTSAAQLNGLSSSQVSASVTTSPSGDGNTAVMVTVTTVQPLYLTELVSGKTSATITASAYAEITSGSACMLALNTGGTGVTLSGGTAVKAPACEVASNATVTVPCGDTITTQGVIYDSSTAPSEPCTGIVPPSGSSSVSITKALTADPLASNSSVTSAEAHLATVSSETAPSAPTVTSETLLNLQWNSSSGYMPPGCSGSFSGSTWTITCSGYSSYNFGGITLGGGETLNFNTSGPTTATYNFSGQITNGGSAMTFGPGTYNVAGGVYGGGTVNFGAGAFNMGKGTTACGDGGYYSICNPGGGTMTFGGPSTFNLAYGVYNSGGATLTLGSGSTNSFQIGQSTTGYAVSTSGGSTTTFANATGSSDLFQLTGNITTGGGSCTTLSAASQHDINGSMNVAGGVILGAGVYSVTGYVDLGGSGGGDVTCNGTGNGVTFAIGGSTTPSSGSCDGMAFCLAAGYSNVNIVAPTTGATQNLVVLGPTSASITAGALFSQGASNTSLSGMFYFPKGPISLSGGADLGGGSGQCLEIVGAQITLTGGTTAASNCSGSSSTTSSVVLVQ